MNNAPAPESEQAGSGRVMRFCWDLQNSGSSLPQRGVHGFDDLLGLGVRLDEHLCGLIEEFYLVNKSLAHELGALTANTNS